MQSDLCSRLSDSPQVTANGEANAARVKRVINRVADDMHTFSVRIGAEIPLFASVYSRMVEAVSRVTLLQRELPSAEDPVGSTIAIAEALIKSLAGARDGADGMRRAAASWPRMSTAMNRARREGVEVLDRLVAEFEHAIEVTRAVVEGLR
jgi:hypothetical protein